MLGSVATTSHSCIFGNADGDSLEGPHYENLFVSPGLCEHEIGNLTLEDGSPCLPEGNPWGVAMGAYGLGECGTGVDDGLAPVAGDRIQWIRPNPAGVSGSKVRLAGVPRSSIEVSIFDLRGRLVRSLAVIVPDSGQTECSWDLRDGRGEPVASGIYFIEASTADSASARTKVVVVR